MPRELTWADFTELCRERRREFVACERDIPSYRAFLTRNGFNATDANMEIEDALVERHARTQELIAEMRARDNDTTRKFAGWLREGGDAETRRIFGEALAAGRVRVTRRGNK